MPQRRLRNCVSFAGIGPSYNTSSVQPYVDAGLERYVVPFLTRVERELVSRKVNYMPANIADRRLDELILGSEFQKKFPVTHQHLTRIAAEFTRSDVDVAWQNIGNSCRQALIEFCGECAARLELALPDATKRADVKTIARALIRKIHGADRFASALEALVVAVWDYAQPLTHRPNATRDEAVRMYLWTGLAISELAQFV